MFRTLLAGLFGLVDKGWADQEVVVRMLAAGALLKEQRFDEAASH